MSRHSCRPIAPLCFLLALVAPAAATPGSLDPGFGDAGFVRLGFGHGDDYAPAMAPAAGGKLVVAATVQDAEESKSLVVRYNADGSRDATFGQDGAVWIDNPGQASGRASVAVQADGRIVVSEGSLDTAAFTWSWNVTRLLADGSTDASFGAGGLVSIPFAWAAAPMALTVQADGKIVLAGYSPPPSGNTHLTVARLQTDGSLDPAFGGNGIVNVVQGLSSRAEAVGILNGKILVAGRSHEPTGHAVFLAQFNDDGSLDTAFDLDGKVTTAVGSGAEAHALTFQTSPVAPTKILVAGHTVSSGTGLTTFLVARYLSNGSLDTSFDADGILVPSISSNNDRAHGIRVRYSGGNPTHLVVAGTVDDLPSASLSYMAVAKFTLAGTWDTTFDGDGLSLDRIGGLRTTGEALLLTSTGTVLCAGGVGTIDEASNLVVVRRNLGDGSHDATFDGDGVRTDDFGNAFAYCKDVVRMSDGRILLAGYTSGAESRFAVSRLLPDGSPDGQFDGDGKATLAFGSASATCRAIALQADGRIVLAGNVTGTMVSSVGVARLNSDGSPDSTFGSAGTVSTIGASPSVTDVLVQPDGGVVVTGYEVVGSSFVIRYLPDGSLDTGFGAGVPAFPAGWILRSSSLQPDGRILVVGDLPGLNGFRQAVVLRLLADGSADPGFGAAGLALLPPTLVDTVWLDMELLPDGRILVVGQEGWTTAAPLLTVARFLPNGTPDPSLGGTGVARIPISSTAAGGTHAVAIQADGQMVIAAKASSGFDVLRLNVDGGPDLAYGFNGWASATDTGSPIQVGAVSGIVVDAAGNAIVTGTLGSRFAAARLLGDPATSVPTAAAVGNRTLTLRAHPNPTSGASIIRLESPGSLRGRVSVYDVAGRMVRQLNDGRGISRETREVRWDGRDDAGRAVAAGVYFVRATAGEQTVSTRVTVRR